jgi:hypothetical protein
MFQHIFTNDPEQRNTPQDMRPITMLDYTIKSLKNLQMHGCKKGTMQLGTGGTCDMHDCKIPKKIAMEVGKEQEDKTWKREKKKTICAKRNKGLHRQCFPEHKCSK